MMGLESPTSSYEIPCCTACLSSSKILWFTQFFSVFCCISFFFFFFSKQTHIYLILCSIVRHISCCSSIGRLVLSWRADLAASSYAINHFLSTSLGWNHSVLLYISVHTHTHTHTHTFYIYFFLSSSLGWEAFCKETCIQ